MNNLNNAIFGYYWAAQYFLDAQNKTIAATVNITPAQLQQLASTYANLWSSLTTGSVARAQGQAYQFAAASDLASGAPAAVIAEQYQQAKDYYVQAIQAFSAGGDPVDASSVQGQLAAMALAQALAEGPLTLNQFITNDGAALSSYLTYISTANQATVPSDYRAVLNDLRSSCSSTAALYQQVYVDMPTTTTPSQILSAATLLLNNVVMGVEGLIRDYIMLSKKVSGTSHLDNLDATHYAQVLQAFSTADQLYGPAVAPFIPLYGSLATLNATPSWSFKVMGARSIARSLIDIASTAQGNPVVAFALYNAATAYSNMLTPAVDAFLTVTMATIKLTLSSADLAALVKRAKHAESEARALTTTVAAWQLPPTVQQAGPYGTQADHAWQKALNRYLLAYQAGDVTAAFDYIATASRYAHAYKKNVSKKVFPVPALGAAFINYNGYAMASTTKAAAAAPLAKDIQTTVGSYFAQAIILVQQVSQALTGNAGAQLLTVTGAQAEVTNIATALDQLVNGMQQLVMNQLPGVPPLVTESKDANGDMTFVLVPTQQTVTIPNPAATTAALYKKLGDYYWSTADYGSAFYAYRTAINNYITVNDTASLAALYAGSLPQTPSYGLAITLGTAALYRDDILTVSTASLGSFTVPTAYALKNYWQPFPLSGHCINMGNGDLSDKATLLSLAEQLYLYNLLSTQVTPSHACSIVAHSATSTVVSGKAAKAQKEAQNFAAQLAQWVQQKTSHLSAQNYAGVGWLLQTNLPTPPGVPGTALPYPNYPNPFIYYSLAASLFFPNPSEQIVLGGIAYTPNTYDTTAYQPLRNQILLTYLSQGYQNQQQLAALKQRKAWQNIGTSLQASSLYAAYTNLVLKTAGMYAAPFSVQVGSYDARPVVDSNGPALNQLLANLFVNAGNDLKAFLIGPPNGLLYSNALTTIGSYYQAGLYYSTDSSLGDSLWANYGQLWLNAGDAFVGNSYFGSQYFYEQAMGYLSRYIMAATQPTPLTTPLFQTALIKTFSVAVVGSINNMAQYAAVRLAPLKVTGIKGGAQTMSLAQLVQQYQACNTPSKTSQQCNANLSSAVTNAYNALAAPVLDAIIYTFGASGLMGIVSQCTGQSPFATCIVNGIESMQQAMSGQGAPPPPSSGSAQVAQAAATLIASFTLQNNISLDTIGTITLFLAQPNFATIALNGFTQFIAEAQTTNVPAQQAQFYAAASQWVTMLSTAFQMVFENDFLGGINAATQIALWNTWIPQEQANINANAACYITGCAG